MGAMARTGKAGMPDGRVALGVILGLMLFGCATVPQSPQGVQDIRIAGSRVFPESITADARGNLYVGSLEGTIYRASPGSATAEPWVRANAQNGVQALFGVLADEGTGRLWTCSNPNPFAGGAARPAASSLVAFDLDDGAFAASFPFPAGPAACNDIAIATDGTLFATETGGGRIFRLAPGGSELELFAQDEALVGVDGIAFAADGTMYINNVRANLVQRVERGADGAYVGLATLELSQPVMGPDALRPIGGNRFLQAEGSGGRVALVDIEGDRATVTPIRSDLQSSPGVTRIGGTVYATEGKINYLVDPALQGQDPGEFHIRAFTLPEGL